MVRNLNTLSFKEFGSILPVPRNPILNEFEEFLEFPERSFVCYSDSIYLERIHGMPIIALSVNGSEPIQQFYLDKPVVILPGIYFYVQILGERGCVRYIKPKSNNYKNLELPASYNDSVFSPQITMGTIYTFFYQEQKKGFLFAGEQHKPYELVYVDSGILHSIAGGQDIILKQGEMFLYMPNQWHMQYAEQDLPVNFVDISFDMDCPYVEMLANRKLNADNSVRQLWSRMLNEQRGNEFLRDDMLQSHLRELIIILLRREYSSSFFTHIDSASTMAKENQIVETAQRYIVENINNQFLVSDIAKSVNVSTSYMSALFRKHLNMPPSKYIRRVKITESKRLIQTGHYNLTEVSALLGYATLQHFSRSFKAEAKITPSEYAKALK